MSARWESHPGLYLPPRTEEVEAEGARVLVLELQGQVAQLPVLCEVQLPELRIRHGAEKRQRKQKLGSRLDAVTQAAACSIVEVP